jgi:peptidoglycan/LPS O-acetylase OafA/YrhL
LEKVLVRPPPTQRLPELDLLRGLAILLVLGRHLIWIPDSPGIVETFFRGWRHIGWMGVDLFFVLSGFLVGGLLIREGTRTGTIRPVSFLVRRGLRIYPAFYLFIGLSLPLMWAFHLRKPGWQSGLLHEVLFIQNYTLGIWPQTWSLAVEEHFYLLLLCLSVFLVQTAPQKSDPFRSLPVWVGALSSAILLIRMRAGYALHLPWYVLYAETHLRLDALLFGVLIAYGMYQHEGLMTRIRNRLRPWRWIGLPLLLAPSLLLDVTRDRYVTTAGLTPLYLAFGWVLVEVLFCNAALKSRVLRALPFLPRIGRHSYSIYLWHFAMYLIVSGSIHNRLTFKVPFVLEAIAYMAAAIACGMAMSYAVEWPILRWRDRMSRSV